VSYHGILGDEVKELYERSFAIHVKHEGLVGIKPSTINYKFGHYYSQLADLPVDKRKFY
jgi:hypothetical protein